MIKTYFNDVIFKEELVKSHKIGTLTELAYETLNDLIRGIVYKKYSHIQNKEDIIQDIWLNMLRGWKLFDLSKDTSSYSYFTTSIERVIWTITKSDLREGQKRLFQRTLTSNPTDTVEENGLIITNNEVLQSEFDIWLLNHKLAGIKEKRKYETNSIYRKRSKYKALLEEKSLLSEQIKVIKSAKQIKNKEKHLKAVAAGNKKRALKTRVKSDSYIQHKKALSRMTWIKKTHPHLTRDERYTYCLDDNNFNNSLSTQYDRKTIVRSFSVAKKYPHLTKKQLYDFCKDDNNFRSYKVKDKK